MSDVNRSDPCTQVEEGGQVTAAVGEIKKLNEQVSQLRQENIVLKVRPDSPVPKINSLLESENLESSLFK